MFTIAVKPTPAASGRRKCCGWRGRKFCAGDEGRGWGISRVPAAGRRRVAVEVTATWCYIAAPASVIVALSAACTGPVVVVSVSDGAMGEDVGCMGGSAGTCLSRPEA